MQHVLVYMGLVYCWFWCPSSDIQAPLKLHTQLTGQSAGLWGVGEAGGGCVVIQDALILP